jgi:hypothetical protein
METETVVYERAKLYAEVWAEPTRTVAHRYGLSDVGLAQICKELRVPRPGRGYWARKKAGRKDRRPSLPALAPGEPAELRYMRWISEEGNVASATIDRLRSQGALEPILVDEVLAQPHPLVVESRPLLERHKQGTAHPSTTRRCLAVHVSPTALDRALRLMDALLKALEQRGFPVDVTAPTTERRIGAAKSASPCLASSAPASTIRCRCNHLFGKPVAPMGVPPVSKASGRPTAPQPPPCA